MNLLILNLPHSKEINRSYRASKPSYGFLRPPVELLRVETILTNYLQNFYRNISFIDAIAQQKGIDDICSLIRERDIEAVVCMQSFEFIEEDHQSCLDIKNKTGAQLVVIGHLPHLYPEHFAEYDVILGANYESVIRQSLLDLHSADTRNFVKLLKSNADKQIHFDPDIIVMPDRNELKPDCYKELFTRGRTAYMQFGFGCPYRCSYCIHPYGLKNYMPRDVENVKKELLELDRKQYKNIRLMDDSVPLYGDQLYEINDYLRFKDMNFRMYGSSRIDLLNEEMIMLLREMNFKRLFIGVESFEQKRLVYYSRETNTSQQEIIEKFRFLRKMKIETAISLIFDPKRDQGEHIATAFRMLRQLKPDLIYLNELRAYPGTLLFEREKENMDFSLMPFRSAFKDNTFNAERVKWDIFKKYYFSLSGLPKLLKYLFKYPKQMIKLYQESKKVK